MMDDLISRKAAIDAIHCDITVTGRQNAELVAATIGAFVDRIKALPSAQPEIVRRKDRKYGEQDDTGRWFCNDLGCQIGSEDGSGYCADAEKEN